MARKKAMSTPPAAARTASAERKPGEAIRWYRVPIPKEDLRRLNQRSDLLGGLQTLGFLAVLAGTGTLFVWCCFHAPWFALPALLLHGACCAFLINGFHELVHDSVFRTRWLNGAFLQVFSFLGWYNHIGFWASHTEHHKFTLHPPDDLEVVQPEQVTWRRLLPMLLFDARGFYHTVLAMVRTARGQLQGEWERHLFEKLKPDMRPAFHRWAKIVLVGHVVVVAVSVATGWWPVAVAVATCRFWFPALQFLTNATQHIGLQDRYPDYRVCCRTIQLNPLLRFLYWHMNFHTEHHMYPGVPCYNLGKLHRLVRHELPPTTRGLVRTWLQIRPILQRQAEDPSYRWIPDLPEPRAYGP
jgi:fatty acid desaturase